MRTRFPSAALAASTLFVLTLASGAAALASPAASDQDATRKAAVSFADLNLNSPEGQAILQARIHRAAEAVCGPEPSSHDLEALTPYRRCLKQSLDTALAALPSPSQVAGKLKPAG